MSRPTRILFIARAFPPTVGGMEKFAFELRTHLEQIAPTRSIVNVRGKKALPFFLPYAVTTAVQAVRRGEIDIVHLADALMAPAGVVIKAATGVPVTTTVHGLDVTYGARMYQALIPRALRHLDLAIADSVATERSLHERTGALPRSEVIPLGVNSLPRPDDASSRRFEESIGVAGAPVLLTVGRLVPRKGVAWFVQQVLPDLPRDVVYMVIGQGAERDAILAAASAAGVSSRVRLLGHVDDGVLAAAYARADVFVMPNIDIPGDMEGFGLVALEAAAAGVPVVAARLEGITEAVRHGRNGFLLPSRDADAFVGCLKRLLALPAGQRRTIGERMARYALDTFGWDKTATRYLEVMEAEVNCQRQHEARCADAAA